MTIWQPTIRVNIGNSLDGNNRTVEVTSSINHMFECASIRMSDAGNGDLCPSVNLIFYDIESMDRFSEQLDHLRSQFEKFLALSKIRDDRGGEFIVGPDERLIEIDSVLY